MIGYPKPRLMYPYIVPFPGSVEESDWDDFWIAQQAQLSPQINRHLTDVRLTPFHFPVLRQPLYKLMETRAERVLFVGNGISLVPYFFSIANTEYKGLEFIQESIFCFSTSRRYDCILLDNLLEFLEDSAVVLLLQKLESLLVPIGSVILSGPLFEDIFTERISLSQLSRLFALIYSSGLRFADQNRVIQERKKSLTSLGRFRQRRVFEELEALPWNSESTRTLRLFQ